MRNTPQALPLKADGSFFRRLVGSPEFAGFAKILKRLTGLSMALNTPDVGMSRLGIADDPGNPICQLIRSTPEGKRRCETCDRRHHAMAGRQGKSKLYRCHAGFLDMAIPITIQGEHVATISSGQVLPEDKSPAAFARLHRRLHWLGLKRSQLYAAYRQAPWLPADRLREVLNLLELFSRQMISSAWRIRELEANQQRSEIRLAQALIEKHFADSWFGLSQVAAGVGLSAAHFSVLFHRTMGVTFTRYVQTRRVEEAKYLLVHSARSITDICHTCGFNSLTHFNRIFRRATGGSPTAYRQQRTHPRSI